MDNETFDKYIDKCLKKAFNQDNSNYVINIDNVRKVSAFYAALSDAFKDRRDVALKVIFNDPFPEMGCVKIITKNKVAFTTSELMVKLVGLSHSLSITPRTDGYTEISFGFIDLAREISTVDE